MAYSSLPEDMKSFPVLEWMSPALAAIVVVLVALLSGYKRTAKRFNVPILGEDSTDPNALKMRYVQEADALLREGYEKVVLPQATQVFRPIGR
jgi:hypothetical protein